MPITQQPTLRVIDQDHNQFEVQFGLQMIPGESPLAINVPNLGEFVGDTFTVDFLKVNTPARGNFPAFRCLQIVLQTTQQGTGAVGVGIVYLVNPQTAQVIALLAPAPADVGKPTLILANIPFFCKSNQAIAVYRAPSSNCIVDVSATAFTFDCDSFLTIMPATP